MTAEKLSKTIPPDWAWIDLYPRDPETAGIYLIGVALVVIYLVIGGPTK